MYNYSILMSVYFKEKPEYLRRSIESSLSQTVPTNDFVIVCDGKLTPELDAVLAEFKNKYSDIITIVRYDENRGLSYALNSGLKIVKNDIVMRIDSDDISIPERAEKQLPFMVKYDLVSSWVNEFEGPETNIVSVRKIPEHYKEIVEFSKKRCPFAHPAVMYKKSALAKVDNYIDIRLFEDYYLWIRFLQNNKNVYNIQESLVNMRTSEEAIDRRSSIYFKKGSKFLRKYMYKTKYLNFCEYSVLIILHFIYFNVPRSVRKFILRKVFRK